MNIFAMDGSAKTLLIDVMRIAFWIVAGLLFAVSLGALIYIALGPGDLLTRAGWCLSLGSMSAIMGNRLLITCDEQCFRLTRVRWQDFPAEIHYRQSPFQKQFGIVFTTLLFVAFFSGMTIRAHQEGSVSWALICYLLALVFAGLGIFRALRPVAEHEAEIGLDSQGLHTHLWNQAVPKVIPWDAVEKATIGTLHFRVGRHRSSARYLVLTVSSPERYGFKPVDPASWMLIKPDGNVVAGDISGFLETPERILEDILAFQARYHRPAPKREPTARLNQRAPQHV